MGKQFFDKSMATRGGDLFQFKPEKLIIVKDPTHPLYDPRVEQPLTTAFVTSVDKDGCIEPVVVCRDAAGNGLVVAGRRRTRAACLVNEKRRKNNKVEMTVPCVVRKGTPQTLALLVVAENEQREDDPLPAKAEKAMRMLNLGHAISAVADAFGQTTQTISNWIRLTELAPCVWEAVRTDKIAPHAALQLHGMSDLEQKTALTKLFADAKAEGKERPTMRQVARRAAASKTGKPRGPRMRTRKEILKETESRRRSADFRAGLRWVLNEGGEPAAADADAD